ncbi:16S rRNA (uracil(1498)-N(3))-methyltransferase [SAR202 cluster bacterium AC-409-J13_OGT_754m]|nr:16S rRNA (uracil(1498)-N(3))-methyltransferase [SAR202 cluster bacterium AC-409-J13_OGT_754m]
MKQFFVDSSTTISEKVYIRGELAHRITKVLRAKIGERLLLLDGQGLQYLVELERVDSGVVDAVVLSINKAENEPNTKIILCQALLKNDKFDWVLQKCTEIGVSKFVPMLCRRTIPRIHGTNELNRLTRWKRIITEAAEQSQRSLVPEICSPIEFDDACKMVDRNSSAFIPWEEENFIGIKKALLGHKLKTEVYIFVGPEGGFDSDEVNRAKRLGIQPVSIGKRILRSETAGLVTSSIILYQADDLERD